MYDCTFTRQDCISGAYTHCGMQVLWFNYLFSWHMLAQNHSSLLAAFPPLGEMYRFSVSFAGVDFEQTKSRKWSLLDNLFNEFFTWFVHGKIRQHRLFNSSWFVCRQIRWYGIKQVLSHTCLFIVPSLSLSLKVQSFWGSRFVLQQLEISFNCAAWNLSGCDWLPPKYSDSLEASLINPSLPISFLKPTPIQGCFHWETNCQEYRGMQTFHPSFFHTHTH